MDEKAMIVEQERLAREKKRKKNRKKKRIAGAVIGVLAVSGIWYGFWGRNLLTPVETTTVEVTAEAGQEIVYASLTSVRGNEIEYTLTATPTESTEQTTDETAFQRGTQATEGTPGGMAGDGSTFQRGTQAAEGTAEGMDEDGSAFQIGTQAAEGTPEGMTGSSENQGAQAGEWTQKGNWGQTSDGADMGTDMGAARQGKGNRTQSSDSTEAVNASNIPAEVFTAQIPVGTQIITRLGTTATFSRLAAGDTVALITQQEGDASVIMKVYIVQ